jgi:hypothetical protein
MGRRRGVRACERGVVPVVFGTAARHPVARRGAITRSRCAFSCRAGRRRPSRWARSFVGHWGVENSLHWILDLVFADDRSRARVGHAAQNLALLRRLALNVVRREQSRKISLRSRRNRAGWDNAYLEKVLGLCCDCPGPSVGAPMTNILEESGTVEMKTPGTECRVYYSPIGRSRPRTGLGECALRTRVLGRRLTREGVRVKMRMP